MKMGPNKDKSVIKKERMTIPPHSVHMNMSLPKNKHSDKYQMKREQWTTFVKPPKNTLTKT